MGKIRLHRQCPYCKSKKGFKIEYQVKGYGYEIRNFHNKVLDAHREIVDGNERACCLNCNKEINTYKLQI